MKAGYHIGSIVVALVLLLSLPMAAAADTWHEVKGGNFTVVSNASERRTRSIAWQFEQMRAAIAEGLPWARVTHERPVYVIAVKDENSMRAMAPMYWEERGRSRPGSVFVGGDARNYILLRTDLEVEEQGMNPHSQAYWAYSALVLRQSLGGRLPLWITNGLAGVLSNTIVRAREVEFGKPMPWMAEQAREGPRLPLAELLGIDSRSPYYQGGITRERFDAQTWALVQFLIFGYKDNAGPKFDQLIQRLASGMDGGDAIASVYGSIAAVEDACLLYVQQSVYAYGRLPTSTAIVEEKLPVREASEAEQAAIRAGFHAAMRRPAEARALLVESRAAAAGNSDADDVEAVLLDEEQQTAEALAMFEKAAAAGSTSFWTYYRLATLRAGGSFSAAEAPALAPLVERATLLNPLFVPAYSFLANIHTVLRNTDQAVAAARRAVELDAANVSHYVQLARVLAAGNLREEAAAVAQQALPLAGTAQDRNALEVFLSSAAQ